MLKTVHKKLVVDEQRLGLDLNEEAVRDLEHARHDRDTGKKEAFLDINTL